MNPRIVVLLKFPLMVNALEALLEHDFEIRAFDSLTEYGSSTKANDLVILGSSFHPNLRETLRRCSLNPPRPTILVAPETDTLAVLIGLREGVAGLLSPESRVEEFSRTVWAVAAGRRYLTPRLSDKLLTLTLCPDAGTLTAREAEVLRLVTEGRSEKEIGSALSLSPHTIHSHKKRLMEKFQVDSQLKLAIAGLRLRELGSGRQAEFVHTLVNPTSGRCRANHSRTRPDLRRLK